MIEEEDDMYGRNAALEAKMARLVECYCHSLDLSYSEERHLLVTELKTAMEKKKLTLLEVLENLERVCGEKVDDRVIVKFRREFDLIGDLPRTSEYWTWRRGYTSRWMKRQMLQLQTRN